MDFALTEEQEALRRAIRAFAAKEITPLAAERDETNVYPAELFKQMAGLGYLGLKFPAEYGGGDGSILATAIMFE
ncbi:partial Acyl-CoA dehydrogenase, short-chain specific, partial [Gammaproteobacteria bacterium]